MIHVVEHIPGFCEGFTPRTADVSTIEELHDLTWVNSDLKIDEFSHFAIEGDGDRRFLMSYCKDGSAWVKARLQVD